MRLLICARALGKIANVEQVNHDTVRVTWREE
jgi:hypothetical protein